MTFPGKPSTPEPSSNQPATLAQIRAACTGCDDRFVLTQIERAATLPDAKSAYIGHLEAKLSAREAELRALQSRQAQELEQLRTAQNARGLTMDEEIDQLRCDLANARMGEVSNN